MSEAQPPVEIPKELSEAWAEITPILKVAIPAMLQLAAVVQEAVAAAEAGDVSPEKLDAMMERIEAKNEAIQAIKRERLGEGS